MGATWRPQPRSRVRALRRRYRDSTLDVDAVSGYGFRAECDCGWKGARHARVTDARTEKRAHMTQAHP